MGILFCLNIKAYVFILSILMYLLFCTYDTIFIPLRQKMGPYIFVQYSPKHIAASYNGAFQHENLESNYYLLFLFFV